MQVATCLLGLFAFLSIEFVGFLLGGFGLLVLVLGVLCLCLGIAGVGIPVFGIAAAAAADLGIALIVAGAVALVIGILIVWIGNLVWRSVGGPCRKLLGLALPGEAGTGFTAGGIPFPFPFGSFPPVPAWPFPTPPTGFDVEKFLKCLAEAGPASSPCGCGGNAGSIIPDPKHLVDTMAGILADALRKLDAATDKCGDGIKIVEDAVALADGAAKALLQTRLAVLKAGCKDGQALKNKLVDAAVAILAEHPNVRI